MNNGDLPITPLVNDNGHPMHESQIAFGNDLLCLGLTKREHFAGLAMQGLLGTVNAEWYNNARPIPKLAEQAVEIADALLKALENNHE